MDTKVAVAAIRVIRAESDSRAAGLSADPDAADAEWLFDHSPFLNELCLTILVAVFHELEREELLLAARTGSDGKDISQAEYKQAVDREREKLRKRGGRADLNKRLALADVADWQSMETLRLVANAYKHNPSGSPDNDLLEHLSLPKGESYASLSESEDVRKALASALALESDADYCDIADDLVARAARFIDAATHAQAKLSRVKRGPVSLATFAR